MSSNLKVNTILPSTGTAIGIGTASGNVDVLGHIVGHNTPNISGINSVTATTFYGSGANLTGITGTTINNNAANRIITGSGSANTLEGNSNFTYTGSVVTHSNPSGLAKLDVKGDVSGGALGASISVRNTNSANNGSGEFQFQDPGSNIFAKIAGVNLTDGSNNGYMTFHTSSATSGLVERLRIDSSGHVGIGTDNPAHSLQGAWNKVLVISAGTSNGSMIRFIESSSAAGGTTTGLLFGQHDSNTYLINYQNGFLQLRTNNTERLRIANNGAFGLSGTNYGSSGQVLTSQGSGSAPTWATPSGGHTETYAHVVFGAVYDTNSGYILHNITSVTSNGITGDTSNEKLTPTVAGRYLIIYNAHWNGLYSSGATYYNRITKNGSEEQRSTFASYTSGSHMHTVMCTTAMNGSSDYIQFEFYENKSGQTAAHVTQLSRAVMILLDT